MESVLNRFNSLCQCLCPYKENDGHAVVSTNRICSNKVARFVFVVCCYLAVAFIVLMFCCALAHTHNYEMCCNFVLNARKSNDT